MFHTWDKKGEKGKIAVPLLSHYLLHFFATKVEYKWSPPKRPWWDNCTEKNAKNCNKIDRTLYIQKKSTMQNLCSGVVPLICAVCHPVYYQNWLLFWFFIYRYVKSNNSSYYPCNWRNPYRAWNALPLQTLVAPSLSLAEHCQAIAASVMQICHPKSANSMTMISEWWKNQLL